MMWRITFFGIAAVLLVCAVRFNSVALLLASGAAGLLAAIKWW